MRLRAESWVTELRDWAGGVVAVWHASGRHGDESGCFLLWRRIVGLRGRCLSLVWGLAVRHVVLSLGRIAGSAGRWRRRAAYGCCLLHWLLGLSILRFLIVADEEEDAEAD